MPLLRFRFPGRSERKVINDETKTETLEKPSSAPIRKPKDEDETDSDDDTSEQISKFDYKDAMEEIKKTGWIKYLRRYSIFVPHIWPHGDRLLQLRIFLTLLCLVLKRILRAYEISGFGAVIDALGSSPNQVPIREILQFLFFHWMERTAILDKIQSILWGPVQDNANKSLALAVYEHAMALSCSFHDNNQGGFWSGIIGQKNSVFELLETVFFIILPTLTDLGVATAYLCYSYGWKMSVLVFASTITYFWVAKHLAMKQAAVLRSQIKGKQRENSRLFDSLHCWVSVAYFDNFGYERRRYSEAKERTLKTNRKSLLTAHMASVGKESLLEVQYCAFFLFGAYRISHGIESAGDLLMFLRYWERFIGPLQSSSWIKQNLQTDFSQVHRLLRLLQYESLVKEGSAEFKLAGGAIEFENVNFSYPKRKNVIKGLNFSASAGQKVALVGESGGGKSTILKLLFRFYDVSAGGSIKIDGQDVRDVTLSSLRRVMGVVPQQPKLFRATVMNNVRYSKLDATDEDVMEACKAAAIHDKIMRLPKGYDTMIFHEAANLSGGESQRIAIARAMLKNPKIILLDEATSSVDSQTEVLIQKALKRLTQGRTTFVIAHRLSTVMDADVMLLIKDGRIVEQGSPKELLKNKGEFHKLWSLQNIAIDLDLD